MGEPARVAVAAAAAFAFGWRSRTAAANFLAPAAPPPTNGGCDLGRECLDRLGRALSPGPFLVGLGLVGIVALLVAVAAAAAGSRSHGGPADGKRGAVPAASALAPPTPSPPAALAALPPPPRGPAAASRAAAVPGPDAAAVADFLDPERLAVYVPRRRR